MVTIIKKEKGCLLVACPCGRTFTTNKLQKMSRCVICSERANVYMVQEVQVKIKKLNKKERTELFNAFIAALDMFYERANVGE